MKENIIRLKAILDERERVWKKTMEDYERYKKNPPGSPDGNIVALEQSVATLYSAASDLARGYQEYIAALEQEISK